MPSDAPFFIVGSSRSGTTLLRLMINGHSRLHIPPETWFLLPLVEKFPLQAPLNSGELEEAMDIITSHFRWRDMQIETSEFRREVLSLKSPRLRDVMEIIYRRNLLTVGKPRFGDKTPPYIGIIPQLSCVFPEAKFIHIIRDGRDVAVSFIDAGFKGRVYDGERFEWINAIHTAWKYHSKPEFSSILEIRYENLVVEPVKTLGRICDFLGEQFEDSMLDYQSRTKMVPQRGHIHEKLHQPLKSDAIGVWETKLSAPSCFVMEACLYNELRASGYSLRFNSSMWRPLMALSACALRAIAPFLKRLIPALQRRKMLPEPFYF